MAAELPDDHGWVFDLVNADAGHRGLALARHRQLLEESAAGLRWANRVWAKAGTPAPQEPHLAAEMDQARAAFRAARQATLFGPIDAFCSGWQVDPVAHTRYAPFALLFLQWEARYPQEWREAGSWTWSPWSQKEALLKRFMSGSVPPEHRRDGAVLVVAAITRAYRCKDWMYAPFARHVDSPALRDQIRAAADAAHPLTSLRCHFLLHVLDHPGQRVKYHSWRRWLAGHP